MKKLSVAEYRKILPILESHTKTTTFAYAVCDQVIDGEVFVNEKLTAGLIRTANGIYYVFGHTDDQNYNEDLFLFIKKAIEKTEKRFTLFTSSEEWEMMIEERFSNVLRNIPRMKFQSATFEERKRDCNKNTYEVKRIDRRDIERSSEFTEEYYKEYWGSKETFLNGGFGFCIEQGGMIVAECVSIFSGNGFAEIDIVTHKAYQGKGLAQAVATRFMEHCMQNDITPCWDCYVDNISSQKLANKLSFHNPIEYSLFVRKKTGE
ncbi:MULTISPECIES: GNAT family N-acetyltransferase [Bacillus cereus group]|uniref:Acetyltransferase, GNAT family n=1 Tax=Bacillus cereus (strain AH820) TaxID=405535 RepID=B7JRZ6_BACC0|nr:MULTISPECIES: GNAT family N-acetyltransferase [Bacillus cereus group]ACK88072.1 acetyltransferase, GNAT family [Bacillus cereus AH820]AJH80538.1 acetyltransferase domain protein [Bacillus thuringiensis]MCU5692158.1 GNAT family N-acetyltransferase [Bacillus cereus]MDV6366542.1 GNAT family N-acetyltransferase [Bacillus cereus]PGB53237.1 GNAT family N-acetyltransferase [Bacillus anthracis]